MKPKKTTRVSHSTKLDNDDARRFGRYARRMEVPKAQALIDARAEGFGSHHLDAVAEGWEAERRDTAHGWEHATMRRTTMRHATKKTPGQLDSEIAQAVGKWIDRKKLGEMMGPWGGDFAYGEGTGAIGAVSSYYYSDKKYPDRKWVERALKAIEADVPRAEHGAHGWTKSDAKDLRKIAQGLRYYLRVDYA
jgi:hypothetical protein